MDTILTLEKITKRYPGVVALNDVSMSFAAGEVHAIMGENGAGKSTLIKIIAGAIKPDSGQIAFEGNAYAGMNPMLSQKLGIGVIYQEFNLVPELSIAENIFLGRRVTNSPLVDHQAMNSKAQEIIDEFGIALDVAQPVKKLTVAYQQMVEIAKSISNQVKVLIMDEPSAPLTNREIEAMFGIIQKLKARGITIIYISHRMDEIFRVADRVTIMRDGCYIDTKPINEITREELIRLMVGRVLDQQYPSVEKDIGDIMLEVRNLSTPGLLKDISFNIRSGEIVGLAGLVGAGRTETARAIYGADASGGEVLIDGKPIQHNRPKDGIASGVALIPEDRKQHGVLLEMNIRENISFIMLPSISKATIINRRRDREVSKEYIGKLRIKTPGMEQRVKNLSGGNQQKVVLAKSLAIESKVMIFDEPTRGIDVGAKYEIYQLINQLAQNGMAILMISSEMPELLGMSDRILVMREGRIAGELGREDATQEKILSFASGQSR